MVATNTSAHSECVQVIKCASKPGSVERSIDLFFFIVRRVESRYENSRGGRTCSRDRFGYKKIYEGSMIEERL
jgi:hypothetical protein